MTMPVLPSQMSQHRRSRRVPFSVGHSPGPGCVDSVTQNRSLWAGFAELREAAVVLHVSAYIYISIYLYTHTLIHMLVPKMHVLKWESVPVSLSGEIPCAQSCWALASDDLLGQNISSPMQVHVLMFLEVSCHVTQCLSLSFFPFLSTPPKSGEDGCWLLCLKSARASIQASIQANFDSVASHVSCLGILLTPLLETADGWSGKLLQLVWLLSKCVQSHLRAGAAFLYRQ